MAIRSPKHNSDGFSLIEMVAVLLIISIVAGFTLPSFISFNKPLRQGAAEFTQQISLARSKAIASNRSYRIRPFIDPSLPATTPLANARKFIVEYANNCRITNASWTRATQFDIDLPKYVGITDLLSTTLTVPGAVDPVTFNNTAPWNICFDSRGVAANGVSVILKDFKGDSRAKLALFNINPVGGIEVITYDVANNPIDVKDKGKIY